MLSRSLGGDKNNDYARLFAGLRDIKHFHKVSAGGCIRYSLVLACRLSTTSKQKDAQHFFFTNPTSEFLASSYKSHHRAIFSNIGCEHRVIAFYAFKCKPYGNQAFFPATLTFGSLGADYVQSSGTASYDMPRYLG